MAKFAMIGSRTLQPADGNRLAIDLIAPADRLARARAGASQHARNDVCFAVQKIRWQEPAGGLCALGEFDLWQAWN